MGIVWAILIILSLIVVLPAVVPVSWPARIARPLLRLMGAAGQSVLALLGVRRGTKASVSVEDIEQLLKRGAAEGVLDPMEQRAAGKALRLGDRAVRELMRPRIDIDAMDIDTPADEVVGTVAMAGFSRLPVYEGDLDHIIGFVYTKDLLRQIHLGWPIELRRLVRPALLVPATLRLDKLLEMFREKRTQMAFVLDEFGGTEGLITMEDVLEELVGEIHDEHRQDRQQEIVRRDETSWLVDGGVPMADLLEQMGLGHLRSRSPRGFATVAGLILFALERIPRVGERVTWEHLAFEVVDMDGSRIDRVLVSPAPRGPTGEESPGEPVT